MSFWRRFRLYLFGIGLGLLFVYAVFGDRDVTAWVPERKILRAIDSSEVTISPIALCQLQCNNLSKEDIPSLMTDADIDFWNSETSKKPCPLYQITTHKGKYFMIWEVCEKQEQVQLLSFEADVECDC